LYPNFFIDHGDTQDIPITSSSWLYFDMIQNDSWIKLKNDQNLGRLEEKNVSSYFEKNNDDLNSFVKYELGESLSYVPFPSFLCPTYIDLEHDQNRTLESKMVKIENKFVDIGFIREKEMVHVNNSKMNKIQAKCCSRNKNEENNLFKDIFKDIFNEAHTSFEENVDLIHAHQYKVGEKKVIYDSPLCFDCDNIIDLGQYQT
jgi:GTPase SAR1 family protein